MKRFFLPVMMLGLFAFSNVQAQTPVTVKKAPAPVQVTKTPPITVTKGPTTVTKAPPINVAPANKTTTTTKTSTTKTSTTKTTTTTAPAKAAAPVQKTTTVKKTTIVKKTTTVKRTAPAKKAVAKKAHTAPVAPPPPPPPPPPVQQEVILPRPTEEPVVTKEVREVKVSSGDRMNMRDDDQGNESYKKDCCAHGHQDCCDKYDQPWRFRNRHHSTYEYINSFYNRNCESDCKKHCDHDKKHRDNED